MTLMNWTPITNNMSHVAQKLSEGLVKRGVPISFGVNPAKVHSDDLGENELLTAIQPRWVEGVEPEGVLHDNQIETICDVIAMMHKYPNYAILIHGMMQCGKTGTAHAAHFIGPIFYLLTGKKYYPISLMTNRKGHLDQTSRSFKAFMALYGSLTITRIAMDGEQITLNEYHDLAKTLKLYQIQILKGLLDKVNLNPMLEAFDNESVARTNNKNMIRAINELCCEANSNGFLVLLIIDEIHWGSEKKGVMSLMLETILAGLQDTNEGHVFIGLSATAFELVAMEKVKVVNHRLGEGFCGFNFANGGLLDADAKIFPLDLRSMADVGLENLTISTMKSQVSYVKARSKNLNLPTYLEDYVDQTLPSLATFINTRSQKDAAVNLRFVNNNDYMGRVGDDGKPVPGDGNGTLKESLLYLLAKAGLDEDIFIIPYNADASKISIKALTDRLIKAGKRILVVVTGAARMADSYPAEFRTFIDFTGKPSNASSALQGSVGRAHGYGKARDGIGPMVVLTQEYLDYLNVIVESDGSILINPGPRAKSSIRLEKIVQYEFERSKFISPEVTEAFNLIQSSDALATLSWTKKGDKLVLKAKHNPIDVWSILTPVLPQLDAAVQLYHKRDNLLILRPGEENGELSYGEAGAGFRSFDSVHHNETMDRANRRKTGAFKTLLKPQIAVRLTEDGTLEVTSITLRLKHSVQTTTGIVLPTNKHMLHDMVTDADRKAA